MIVQRLADIGLGLIAVPLRVFCVLCFRDDIEHPSIQVFPSSRGDSLHSSPGAGSRCDGFYIEYEVSRILGSICSLS